MKREEFFKCVRAFVNTKSAVNMIEDEHKYFRDKKGPVAMVSVDNYGWKIEPSIDFFFWASKRNRLRACAAYLQMVRYSKDFGVCVVRAGDGDVMLCEHLRGYDLLFPCGKIPCGRPDGDEHLFYVKCKARAEEERKAA